MRRLSSFVRVSLLASLTGAAVLVAAPERAEACGGCFHGEKPPATPTSQSNSVVTDHRMVLSLSSSSTTLWDQIQYVGDPADFAWVLPVHGNVVVGVGSSSFIDALDQGTNPTVTAPVLKCKSGPVYNGGFGGDYSSRDSSGCGCGSSYDDAMASPAATSDTGTGFVADGAAAEDTGVVVTGSSVVGPYQTVQVHGDDPGSIAGWLRDHKYVVPKEIEPILKKYVDEGFDFVAVRLRPGKGVQAMRPIRISWKGKSPMLPLRMVAAGVGLRVGIKLFVIGDGRWRTKNFPTFEIDPKGLSWDFQIGRSTYTQTRTEMGYPFDGRAFAMEASFDFLRSGIPLSDPPDPEVDAGVDAAPAKDGSSDAADSGPASEGGLPDGSGADVSDAIPASDAPPSDDGSSDAATPPPYDSGAPPGIDPTATDADIAFGTLVARRVTRLRADLPAKYLDADLELEADEFQRPVSNVLTPGHSTHDELVCPLGVDDGTTPSAKSRPQPASLMGNENAQMPQASSCVVSDNPLRGMRVPAIFGLVAAVGLVRRLRRRNQAPRSG